MKILLTYSSKTGNTEKVAEAIKDIIPEDFHFCKVQDAPSPEEFDVILIGFWVDRAMPDRDALEYMQKIKGKKVGIFATLGAYPDSPHGRESMQNARDIVKENEIIGDFICQGKIDEKLVEMFKSLPDNHPHAITEEKLKRYEIASRHPNEEDFERAKHIFKLAFKSLAVEV
ncbi:flavodoxin family protein [Gottschalkia purinilytica]|uniref:Flavodoxin family protein n=1 Tax=Gottschalkia purinilytica TaxID=1503 RepID=A0A0L0W9Z6_GOTPU|nr:flavodoxin family protein [Gottschalkia purinilytica]KNF08281.1 flavodoxin family protein [Gottschalkia purinilytica]